MNIKMIHILSVLSLVCTILLIGSAVASDINIDRNMSATVVAGEKLTIEVKVSDIGLFGQSIETIPEGFVYYDSSLPDEAVSIKDNKINFILFDVDNFTYTLRAPVKAGSYQFCGVFEDHNKKIEGVERIDNIEVLPAKINFENVEPFKEITELERSNTNLRFVDAFEKSDVVTVNIDNIERRVEKGTLEIELDGKTYELILNPMENKIGKYIGYVKGENESFVFLSARNNHFFAMINFDGNRYTIEKAGTIENKDGKDQIAYIIVDAKDRKDSVFLDGDDEDAIEVPENEDPLLVDTIEKFGIDSFNLIKEDSSTKTLSNEDEVRVDMAIVYDKEFYDLHYGDPVPVIEDIYVMMSVIFDADLPGYTHEHPNVSLNLVDTINDEFSNYGSLDNTNDSYLLINSLREDYSGYRNASYSDLVLLCSGKYFTNNTNTIGRAFQYGDSAIPASGFSVVRCVSFGPTSSYQASTAEIGVVASHELGHNFGAHHQVVNQTAALYYARAFEINNGTPDRVQTIMWTPFNGINESSPIFSSRDEAWGIQTMITFRG